MYSGRFCTAKKAAKDIGHSITDLIERGFAGEIGIYAWGDWFHFDLEVGKPFSMHSVDSPILMNDAKVLALLRNGESATFIVDVEGRYICNRGATDDYLDGVEVTQENLFCLKSEIEVLKAGGHQTDSKLIQGEDEEGRSEERQAYLRPIWEELGKPKQNNKIWSELKRRANSGGPIKQVIGHEEFTFVYKCGSSAPQTRKTFQNDMAKIRKQK